MRANWMVSLGERGTGAEDCATSWCKWVAAAPMVAVFAAYWRKVLRSSMVDGVSLSRLRLTLLRLQFDGKSIGEAMSSAAVLNRAESSSPALLRDNRFAIAKSQNQTAQLYSCFCAISPKHASLRRCDLRR